MAHTSRAGVVSATDMDMDIVGGPRFLNTNSG